MAAYLPTIWAIHRSADSSQHSLWTWCTWLGANLTMNSPLGTGKYIDRLQLNASAWGGDPYNTLRLFAEKSEVYQFSFDYRKVDYFNFIPTFANPLLSQGIFLGQHSFDSTRRTMDFDLTLRPGPNMSSFIADWAASPRTVMSSRSTG